MKASAAGRFQRGAAPPARADVAGADVEAAGRHGKVGDDGLHAVERTVDGGGRFDRVLDAFDADPEPGEARQREAHQPVVDDLLDAGRRQDRDHRVDEGVFGLVRGGRALAGVVVAHQRDHAAPRRGAGEVGVPERVARAVDARPLAVPHAEDAVVAPLAAHLRLLRAPHGGRGEVLVHAGLEEDVVRLEERLGALELLVEAAERRAAIAGDVAGGVQPGAAVALVLHQRQADDRLRPG